MAMIAFAPFASASSIIRSITCATVRECLRHPLQLAADDRLQAGPELRADVARTHREAHHLAVHLVDLVAGDVVHRRHAQGLTRAVVFDLFETLVDYDDTRSREFSAEVAALCGREPEEFHRVWREGRPARETGPMAPYLSSLGIGEDAMHEFLERRRSFSREVLGRPREGVIETLRELRARGLRTGLITVCSEDAVDVWPETPFAGLFDAEVFSCSCGLRKPDPRIYELACEGLGVEAVESIFVGDGANDELAGAERAGMRAILIHRAGEEPPWPEVRDWSGPRITSIRDVLTFV